jgi:hypothetical protein
LGADIDDLDFERGHRTRKILRKGGKHATMNRPGFDGGSFGWSSGCPAGIRRGHRAIHRDCVALRASESRTRVRFRGCGPSSKRSCHAARIPGWSRW